VIGRVELRQEVQVPLHLLVAGASAEARVVWVHVRT
jgi:hypothetical protein